MDSDYQKHNPSPEELIVMIGHINEDVTDVSQLSNLELLRIIRSHVTDGSSTTDGEILNAIDEWRIINVTPDMIDIEKEVARFLDLKIKIEALDIQVKEVRNRIQEYVQAHGNTKTAWATASMTKESLRVSYDSKVLDSLLATMVANGHIEYAEALSHARNETVTQPTLLIKRNKE